MVEQPINPKKGGAEGAAGRRPNGGRAKKLRRDIYKGLPAATWSLVQQVDPQWTIAEITAHFAANPDAGVDSRGAACAMQRACAENGLRAWRYEFGDPARFTHMVVLVEEQQGHFQVHDPLLDLEGDGDIFEMLDRIGNDAAVAFKGASTTRTYVADANLEDEVGRTWLGIPSDAMRGTRLQVRGGLGLLEATSPSYRTLQGSLGRAQLAVLLAEPVALLSPAGEDDGGELAERLGLNVELDASMDAKPEGRPALAAHRRPDQSNGAMQAQMAGIIEQMSIDRSRLFEELMTLQTRTVQLSSELAAAQVTVERAVAEEKQTHGALQQLSEQHELMLASYREDDARLAEALSAAEAQARVGNQAAEGHREEAARSTERLAQMKAEVDDTRTEAQRLAEALRAETAAREKAEAAAEFREELSRLSTAVLTAAEERQRELDEARAEARRLAETLGAEMVARQTAEAAAAQLGEDLSRQNLQAKTAADERQSALDEALAEVGRLAEVLGAAEVEARARDEAAKSHQAEFSRLAAQLRAATDERDQLAARLEAEVSRLTTRLLGAADEHRRALDEARAETSHLATGLSIAEAEARIGAEAAEKSQREIERLKRELEAATLVATGKPQETQRTDPQRDTVEEELRRQLAEALAAVERAASTAARPAEDAGAKSSSILASMKVGSAGVVLPEGGIGASDHRGGCLCYGPYIHLAAGNYRLSLAMERPAFLSLLPSRAIVEVVDGSNYFSRQEVRLHTKQKEWTLDFEMPASARPREIEFRILVGRNSFAKLRDLRLSSLA
jgi:hypothetical protein